MENTNRPHSKNAPGPFYVVDGCCTACGVPVSVAPDLFVYDESDHCYVKRQPRTEEEFDRAFRAIWGAELQCIRYRGDDPAVLRRFAELGEPHLCDVPPSPAIRPVVRDHVTFDTASPDYFVLSAVDLAEAFRGHLFRLDKQRERLGLDTRFRYRFMPLSGDATTAVLTYSWFENDYHSVEFHVIGEPGRRWLVSHFSAARTGGRGVSNQLDDWLKGAGHFCFIRWYAGEDWRSSHEWRDSPQ
jgi:ferredoxin